MTSFFSVADVLTWISGELVFSPQGLQPSNEEMIRVNRLSPLKGACISDLCFFFSEKYQADLMQASPGILVTGPSFVQPLLSARLPNLAHSWMIACEDPYVGMALASAHFSTEKKSFSRPGEIHPTAIIGLEVKLGEGVFVGPYCVLEEGVQVGARTVIQAFCSIGRESEIGEECILFPHVTLYPKTRLGRRVRLHSGAVLGADGFGYAPVRKAGQVVGHQKIHHLGRVWVGDDVEIGANTTVDRGTLSDTVIQDQAKLDNLVHVGHNVKIEQGGVLCGGVAVGGHAVIGSFSYIAGAVGIVNHVSIGGGAQVGAMTLVSKDVPEGGKVVGNPQRDYAEHFRVHAALNRMVRPRRVHPKGKEEKK